MHYVIVQLSESSISLFYFIFNIHFLFQEQIRANKIVFLCIQIQCSSTWGLIPKIISTLSKLNVEVIDNRSWHPRGVDTTLMTEIFVEDDYFLSAGEEETLGIDERIAQVSEAMTTAIRQPVSQYFGKYSISTSNFTSQLIFGMLFHI